MPNSNEGYHVVGGASVRVDGFDDAHLSPVHIIILFLWMEVLEEYSPVEHPGGGTVNILSFNSSIGLMRV